LPALDIEPVLTDPKVSGAIHLINPPGQPNMFYVVERSASLKRFDMSQENPTATTLLTFTTGTDMSDADVSTSGERGFLSAALHPNFDGENEKRAYLLYTPARSFVLREYTIEGDTAVEGDVIFEFSGDTESNHNGGLALFGPDGYLYVGIGDGGGSNDQHGDNGNGQNPNTTYGKILRLDVDAPDEPVTGNLTSADVDGEMVDGRILHYGVRNPWRFTFDRLTEDLWIGDVGQNTWEEVDFLPAGAGPSNFGWAAREGKHDCGACGSTLVGLPAVEPIYEYENPAGSSPDSWRSVTGGYVYRGNNIPGLYGRYLFADYQTGVFYALTADGEGAACDAEEDILQQNQMTATGIASFAEGVDGELYVVHLTNGIYKIIAKQ
jgi:glucose/arabinose dehydrogenase